MTCPAQLVCSMYVDGALGASAAAQLESHLASCASCTTLVAALQQESQVLRIALQNADEAIAVPKFRRPLTAADLLLFGAGTATTAWFAGRFWGALADRVPSGLHWLNPFSSGELLDLFISLVVYLSREGVAMIATTIDSMSVVILSAVLAGGLFAVLKNRSGTATLLSVLLLIVVMPSLSHAIEIRRSEALTTVAAGETIDDTVVLFGESIAIDGTVRGDVVAFARSVIVRGDVGGDLLAFAEVVTIEGRVTGNAFGFGRSVVLSRGQVGRNLYGFGRDVSVGSGTEVSGNAAMFGNSTAVRGRVGIDLWSFSSDLAVSGEVARNVEAYARRVTVLAPARIGGNLTTHLGDEDNLQTAPGATIVGAIDTQVVERPEERNRYLATSFYVRQAVRLGAAFVAGLILLWLFPALRTATLVSGADALKAAGFGLIAVIGLPIFAVIACITIIGIPLGVISVIAWILGLYFAKIVLAVFIGRILFASPAGLPHHAAMLIAGLVVILIAINLPYVGFLMNFVLTIVGLGMILTHFIGRSRWRDAY